jgi:hypothetical protein
MKCHGIVAGWNRRTALAAMCACMKFKASLYNFKRIGNKIRVQNRKGNPSGPTASRFCTTLFFLCCISNGLNRVQYMHFSAPCGLQCSDAKSNLVNRVQYMHFSAPCGSTYSVIPRVLRLTVFKLLKREFVCRISKELKCLAKTKLKSLPKTKVSI